MSATPEPLRFDLARFSEAVRRRLYDRMAEIAFTEMRHTPDEAGLQIVHIAGRWFAVWTDLDEPPTLPDYLRVRLVRIDMDPEQPADIALYDIQGGCILPRRRIPVMKKPAALPILFLLAVALLAACASQGAGQEISEERAIELARQHVTFEPGKVEAVKDAEENRPVWRVTFYGKGVTAENPGAVMIVVLDRRTGEMVSLGMS